MRLVTGRYHQDWLAKDSDWNWRLEEDQGGVLRSVGDIGTHWVDLTGFITGLRASAVLAELVTLVPERRKPARPGRDVQRRQRRDRGAACHDR